MSISEEIVKTALLGTEKYPWSPDSQLGETGLAIQANQTDREDGFMRYAAAALTFESAGTCPSRCGELVAVCPEESRPELPEKAGYWLTTALATGDDILLQYLIHLCQRHGEVIPAAFVPQMLELAAKQPKKAAGFIAVTGERGKWLMGLNPDWQFLLKTPVDEAQSDWETGSHEERKLVLARIRRENPAQAIPMLEKAFPEENANNRADFVELLSEGLSLADEPFLLSLSTDKSKKVKEAATDLLRALPGSAMNRLYQAHAVQALVLREQRVMLVTKKKVLEIEPKVQPSEALFATGIEKVSSLKGVEDHVHWLAQVLAYVEPSVLIRHFGLSAAEFHALLSKQPFANHLLPYLSQATLRFRDIEFARVLIGTAEVYSLDLLLLLPQQERISHYPQMAKSDISALVHLLISEDYAPIARDIGTTVMEALAAAPYQISQPTYRRLALQFAMDMVPRLREYSQRTAEDYGQTKYFASQAAEMLRLLEIKESLKRS